MSIRIFDDNRVGVLDHGYVELIQATPNGDLMTVNSARASFGKRTNELREKDIRLINFLARNGHTSPFRHNMVTFEICAPMSVTRQIQRYVVGGNHSDAMGAWSEMSLRYVSDGFSFYIPASDEWRGASPNKKQGSEGIVSYEIGFEATIRLVEAVDRGLENYRWAIENGVCAEQARYFLNAYALYITWYATFSLQALAWLLHERLRPDAMHETSEYAHAMFLLVRDHFPYSLPALIHSFGSDAAISDLGGTDGSETDSVNAS